jgi:hypothetical protein
LLRLSAGAVSLSAANRLDSSLVMGIALVGSEKETERRINADKNANEREGQMRPTLASEWIVRIISQPCCVTAFVG